MSDLTVIYLTANKIPEKFADYQRNVLRDAMGDRPLISVSREPLDFGHNILDTGKQSHLNMYRQLLNAAKVAETPYVAVAEDDTFYSSEHFEFRRPEMDTFLYNMSRWILFTWNPILSIKHRVSNSTLIAPRELLIEAWEERFKKWPGDTMPEYHIGEVGRHILERQLKVKLRKMEQLYSYVPCIQFNHPNGTDTTGLKKRAGELKAIEIPYWGRAEDLAKLYV